jgi:hypothetical protein
VRIVYVGNFRPDHSTENHLRIALQANGHSVTTVQEAPVSFARLNRYAEGHDFVLWTHTHGLAPESSHDFQRHALAQLRRMRIPVVSYHLDRWWGLEREGQVLEEPFFETDLVCTADGGHDAEWEKAGVQHAWFPPGVLAQACRPGTPRDEYRSELAFVGSHQGGYHEEWTHRAELVRFLRDTYGDRCKFWPKPGEHAVRGDDLCDLYASVDVVIGDSCLVPNRDGSPCARYCSDRIPETLGRGGFLLHPFVPGIVWGDGLWSSGDHLQGWHLGDWAELAGLIELALMAPDRRRAIADEGQRWTLERHSYERRMVELVDELADRGLVT